MPEPDFAAAPKECWLCSGTKHVCFPEGGSCGLLPHWERHEGDRACYPRPCPACALAASEARVKELETTLANVRAKRTKTHDGLISRGDYWIDETKKAEAEVARLRATLEKIERLASERGRGGQPLGHVRNWARAALRGDGA